MADFDLAAIRARYTKGGTRIDLRDARNHVIQLLDRISMLEETMLAVGQLLWDGEDWGPQPPGSPASYRSYLLEGVYEEATEVRDAWKARGWRRG